MIPGIPGNCLKMVTWRGHPRNWTWVPWTRWGHSRRLQAGSGKPKTRPDMRCRLSPSDGVTTLTLATSHAGLSGVEPIDSARQADLLFDQALTGPRHTGAWS